LGWVGFLGGVVHTVRRWCFPELCFHIEVPNDLACAMRETREEERRVIMHFRNNRVAMVRNVEMLPVVVVVVVVVRVRVLRQTTSARARSDERKKPL
jgi:hypothetical protein